MELLAIILLLLIFFTVLFFKSSVNKSLQEIQDELDELRKFIAKNFPTQPTSGITDTPQAIKKETPIKETWQSGFKIQEEILPGKPSPTQEEITRQEQEELTTKMQPEKILKQGSPIKVKTVISPPAKKPLPQTQPSFFERHPDLEKFIGENLISKIGIAILVLAIAYFVKYAIDKNWIGPVARVGIGILFGGILIIVAHRLRSNYKAFSSVLVGGGLAIFYFTIALAYHQFHLFSQTASFIIMVVITIFAVLLSLLYDRQELAVIALVGGFATPLLVSDGGGNFKTLFSYLLILNIGLLVIAYKRSWRILNITAFGFTSLLFLLWMLDLDSKAIPQTLRSGFLFASLFYLLFFVINILNNIKEKREFIASDFTILLTNTALYYSAGIYFLHNLGSGEYKGIFTALLGAFHLGASWLLFRKQNVDRNILYLLIGITVSFVSLTAPVQLEGNNITLFWASECVLLYWLYQRSSIRIIGIASIIVWFAMLISLLMDWVQFYFIPTTHASVVLNRGFVTTFYSAICSYLLFLLHKKGISELKTSFDRLHGRKIVQIVSLILFFLAGVLEIDYQFSYHFPGSGISLQYILLYTHAFILVLYLATNNVRTKTVNSIQFYLLPASLIMYLLSIPANFRFQILRLNENKWTGHMLTHWISILVLGYIFIVIADRVRRTFSASKNLPVFSWLLCAWMVIYLSCEVNLATQAIFFSGPGSIDIINQSYVKSGLPILWGLCSFAFMWLGMKYKFRPLRIISLALFSITLIKLFAFDIRNISAGGKIAAFFCLGVLLLIISFMYQRLKKIIIEDAEKPAV